MGRVFMVASGKGGTGKTMFAVNFAAILAMRGYRTVIVDMDMGQRNVDLYFGLENNVVYDAHDVMTGVCRIRQALIRDERFQKLYMMSASPVREDGTLTPLHAKVLCEKLREQFDYVIIDAPSGVDDGLVIASAGADAAIMVTTPEYASIRNADTVDRELVKMGIREHYLVINNLSSDGIARSVERFAQSLAQSQMIFIPGGFSGGDEPDGSGKFITAFFRSAAVRAGVTELLERRDGLICGVCNGFQALIKLGLVPYGKIIDTDENCPTLTFNTIARHQSRIVRVRVASNKSPWLSKTQVGEIYSVPISHGEGRFLASEELIRQLAANGQIATQYVDLDGNATGDVHFNPNGSAFAVEGICSPDGRVFGKMGHAERIGSGLYKNVPGAYDMHMFSAAVEYFK